MASAIFLAIALGYIINRLNSKLNSLRGFQDTDDNSRYGGPLNLIEKFEAITGPVLVTINENLSYSKNAENLYLSNFCNLDLLKSQNIDLCDSDSDCKTMDVRIFVDEYLNELKSSKTILRAFTYFNEQVYEVYPDEDLSNVNEIKLSVLGFMIGIMVITKSFIGLKFSPIFLILEENLKLVLGNYLMHSDSDQYSIYTEIKDHNPYQLSRNNYFSRQYQFVENSSKPFKRHQFDILSYSDSYSNVYDATTFPLEEAAEAILLTPFKESRSLIFQGMKRVLEQEYNFVQGFSFHSSKNNYILIDNFSDSTPNLNLYQWKDNSIFDRKARIFWKALSNLSEDEILIIFKLATGFEAAPFTGFLRLPKTLIEIDEKSTKAVKFVDRFKIVIGHDETAESLEKALLKQVKTKSFKTG